MIGSKVWTNVGHVLFPSSAHALLADVASQFYDIANRVQTAVKSMLEAKLEATHINSYAPIISDQDLLTVVFVAQWTEWRQIV